MRSTHSFSTDFVIRKCKGDKTKAIDFCQDHDRWFDKRNFHQGENRPHTQAINRTIDDIRFRVKEKYRMLEDAGALITAQIAKDAYLGIHTLQKGHKLIELSDYFKKNWELKLKHGGFKN